MTARSHLQVRRMLARLGTCALVLGLVAPTARPAEAAFLLRVDLMSQNGLQLISMSDPRWGALPIQQTGERFDECGCWLATMGTVFSYQVGFPSGSLPKFPMALDLTTTSGLDLSFSPPYFDTYAVENGGYRGTEFGDCGTAFYPDAFEEAADPVLDPVTGRPLTPTGFTWRTVNGFGPDVRAWVDRFLSRGWPVPVRTEREIETNEGLKTSSHMQMIVGYQPDTDGGGEYLVLDPNSYGAVAPVPESQVFPGYEGGWAATVKDVRFIEPAYDTGSWFGIFDDPEPIELVITDPMGRRMGVDPRTGTAYNEQPTGSYERTNGWTDPLGATPPQEDAKNYWTRNPIDGIYAIEVIGTGTGDWTLDVWNGGADIVQTLTGSTSLGEVDRYTVRLEGGRVIEVTPVPAFEVRADAGPDQTTIPGVSVTVDGYRSWAPPPTEISTYTWDFGDGSPPATGRTATHGYASGGTYTVTLTVADSNGDTDSDTLTVRAVVPPPSGRVTSMVTESATNPGQSMTGRIPTTGVPRTTGATPAVTPDGRYVAWVSRHGIDDQPTGFNSLYRRDTTTGELRLLVGPDSSLVSIADISADGRLITFLTRTAHAANDVNGAQDLYMLDVDTGALELVGVADDESPLPTSSGGLMSSDGRFVVFGSTSPAQWFDGIFFRSSGRPDVFLRDRQLGTTRLLSVALDGTAASGASYPGAVSDDGDTVAFLTFAGSLLGLSGGTFYPLLVTRDLAGNSQTVVDTGGESFNIYPLDMSADGRYVAFLSNGQTPFDAGQQTTAIVPEPFLYDRQTATTTHIAPPIDGIRQRTTGFTSGGYAIDISDDGRWVAFQHRASNIVPGDTNGTPDAYLYEVATGTVTRESVTTAGAQSAGTVTTPTGSPSIDNIAVDDSGAVVFESDASDLTPEIVNLTVGNIYRRGVVAGGSNGAPIAELGGPYIGFASTTDVPTGIRLDGSRSVDPEGETLTGAISAGDGSAAAAGLTATRAYASPGVYLADLDVDDGTSSDDDTASVTVYPSPGPDGVYAPVCAAPGSTVAVGGIARTANAEVLAQGWDTSRGPAPLATVDLSPSWQPPVTAGTALPDLTFLTTVTLPDTPGSYTVTLTGTDETATITVPCATSRPVPVADAGGPYRVVAGTPLQFDGSKSVGARSYQWTFGDGASGTGATPTHTFTTPGTYVVQLVVGDQEADAGLTRAQSTSSFAGLISDSSVFAWRSRAVVEVVAPASTTTTQVPSTTVPPPTSPTTIAPMPPTSTPNGSPPVGIPVTGGDLGTQSSMIITLLVLGCSLWAVSRRRRHT